MQKSVILTHGECLKEMAEIPDNYVDMVLCDLPYGTTQNKWDTIIDLEKLWAQYKRICKGAIILTAAQPFTSVLVCSNLKDFNHAWVWKKSRATGHLNAKRQPMRQTEDVCVWKPHGVGIYNPQGLREKAVATVRKGRGGNGTNYGASAVDALQTHEGYPTNVIEFASEGKNQHPTQKPVALMEYMVKTYTNEGMTVLDNCMGSGTTGVACVNTGRRFIGIEQDAAYFKIAQRRIQEAQKGTTQG
jgi:site-specific DNA-methyltransferase (adenine-specific)